MILVLGGTREAGLLCRKLKEAGRPFITTVVSGYGASLVREITPKVYEGALDAAGLTQLVEQHGVRVIIDMTHPYAQEITELAINLATQNNISYYRFQRPETAYESSLLEVADSYEEAARRAPVLALRNNGSVFLSIGSRRAAVFVEEGHKMGVRVVCRVLPDPGVLEGLLAQGLTPKDIIAVLGPFSHQMNKAMFTEYRAGVIVTKDAGVIGGTDTKISAALEMQVPVLVVRRPQVNSKVYNDINEILRRVT